MASRSLYENVKHRQNALNKVHYLDLSWSFHTTTSNVEDRRITEPITWTTVGYWEIVEWVTGSTIAIFSKASQLRRNSVNISVTSFVVFVLFVRLTSLNTQIWNMKATKTSMFLIREHLVVLASIPWVLEIKLTLLGFRMAHAMCAKL